MTKPFHSGSRSDGGTGGRTARLRSEDHELRSAEFFVKPWTGVLLGN